MGGRAGSVLIITSMVRNPGSPTHSNRGQDAAPQVAPDAFIGQKTFLKTEMASLNLKMHLYTYRCQGEGNVFAGT